MNLEDLDNKRVRIHCIDGNSYEGIANFFSDEYNEMEYGNNEDSIQLLNMIFYKNDITNIELLDKFSNSYGLVEESVVLEAFDELEDYLLEEEEEIKERLLNCLKENKNKLDIDKANILLEKYGGK